METIKSKKDKVAQITRSIIHELYANGNPNKRVLSGIRRAPVVTDPGAQDVWPMMFGKLDKGMLSRTGKPTIFETAIYTTVYLYAIHQQSQDQFVFGRAGNDDTADGVTFWAALSNFRRDENAQKALDRRVRAVLKSTNITSVINGITHLVAILKAGSTHQKIDYARLASELYVFQIGFKQAREVQLAWGQQYYRFIKPVTTPKGENDHG